MTFTCVSFASVTVYQVFLIVRIMVEEGPLLVVVVAWMMWSGNTVQSRLFSGVQRAGWGRLLADVIEKKKL